MRKSYQYFLVFIVIFNLFCSTVYGKHKRHYHHHRIHKVYKTHKTKASRTRTRTRARTKIRTSSTKIKRFVKCVKDVEKQYALPKHLLSAVIDHESSFREKAVNSSTSPKSYGLGQITLPTAKDYCQIKTKRELFQHDKNIRCTAKILKHHIKKYGSIHSALAAYRAGTPCRQRRSRHKRHRHKYQVNYSRMCNAYDEKYISAIVKKKAKLSINL